MNDAETVKFYTSIRERLEALRLVLDIRRAAFVVTAGGSEHEFSSLEQLDCFVRGLEARE
jgi:hypothetical protein